MVAELWLYAKTIKLTLFGCRTWGISVPRPGIEPMPSALEAWSLSVWTIRKSQELSVFYLMSLHWEVFPQKERQRGREREREDAR